MAPGSGAPRGGDRRDHCYTARCRQKEVEAQPEEEEGAELWREAATPAQQLRGRLVIISDNTVTHTDTVRTAVSECTKC